ncbi:ABC transporter permease [Paeniglutamicibacter kerguelensis]|uniref:Peptide/nickel transport system permease protein n=1 Tax=Paeniglutamicibacter kerguelensis TaxID=254788 RepID=A0ABS4XBY8_9MICC|nr:ABC transporter permease [Paeniglutamicibacter kerguelensis]MBP2385209.1 peptide/nickel transport system permease protein [Paeniglutamicibacter kerguelensis]
MTNTASKAQKPVTTKPVATGRSLLATAWLRIRKNRVAMISLVVVILTILFAIFAPVLVAISGQDPNTTNTSPDVLDNFYTPGLPLPYYMYPSAEHWLGVEPGLGRDLFARLAYGAQVSLSIALLSTLVSVVLGTVLGAAAGYFGGKIDMVISRIMDLFLAFPHLLLVLSIAPILQSRLAGTNLASGSFVPIASLVIVLGFFGWAYLARVVRGQVLMIREQEFMDAAKSYGTSHRSMILKQVIPNVSGVVLVYATMMIPANITAEAALSFLGVGVKDPTPSWGQMLNAAQAGNWYLSDPWFLAVPSIALIITVLAFNLLGDALRDALDPKSSR